MNVSSGGVLNFLLTARPHQTSLFHARLVYISNNNVLGQKTYQVCA